MAEKVEAAVNARRDPDFVIIARTDALAVEDFDRAVARAQAYEAAGADVIFPEALTSREEFARFRQTVKVPLLANMTEFGKSPWITDAEFSELGYDLVLHPVTPFRLAARAVKDALREMRAARQPEGAGRSRAPDEPRRNRRLPGAGRLERWTSSKARSPSSPAAPAASAWPWRRGSPRKA